MSIGLIVGTGMDSLSSSEAWSEVATKYGLAYIGHTLMGGREVTLLRRHGPMLNIPPHQINYRANMLALKEAGVRHVFASAAVGSLRKKLRPGSIAIISDFIDFTSSRVTTVYEEPGETVIHTDFTSPYCPGISSAMKNAADSLDIAVERNVTYVCVDGPRYETPAEIRMFSQWGGDVVGMTGVPEAILAREMGICYGALGVVANYGAGILDKPLSHLDVIKGVNAKRESVRIIFEKAIGDIDISHTCK